MHLTNRQRGQQLESMLDRLHIHYRAQGKAHIVHNGVQSIRAGQKIIQKKSQPDYTGCLQGGRLVTFDAKNVKTRNGNHYYYHAAKSAHQLAQLYDYSQFGAIAFLLVVVDDIHHYAVTPLPTWGYGVSYSQRLDQPAPNVYKLTPSAAILGYDVPDWLQWATDRSG